MINLHKKSRLTPLWALSLLSLLWGCASSPPPRYYNLLSTLPAPATQEADARPLAVVDIVNLHLPSALDQDRLLITQADQTITRLPQDRWAGPLEDEVRQVLQRGLWESAQAIENRTAAGLNINIPRYRISLNIEQFVAHAQTGAQIRANWSLRALPEGPTLLCQTNLNAPLKGNTPKDTVLALSEATYALAQTIGQNVRAYPTGSSLCTQAQMPKK